MSSLCSLLTKAPPSWREEKRSEETGSRGRGRSIGKGLGDVSRLAAAGGRVGGVALCSTVVLCAYVDVGVQLFLMKHARNVSGETERVCSMVEPNPFYSKCMVCQSYYLPFTTMSPFNLCHPSIKQTD